jgi:hypothetical protein
MGVVREVGKEIKLAGGLGTGRRGKHHNQKCQKKAFHTFHVRYSFQERGDCAIGERGDHSMVTATQRLRLKDKSTGGGFASLSCRLAVAAVRKGGPSSARSQRADSG